MGFDRAQHGHVMCLRSSSRRIAPGVNRTDGVGRRLALKRGNPAVLPWRLPRLESPQFFNARASWSRPVAYDSFEPSAHHGATSPLAWFQALRIEYIDQ